MNRGFWQGMLLGSVLTTVLGAGLGSMKKFQRKPLVERSADAVISTTKGLMKEARKTRRRIMQKID